jgi:hypothetical protein
MGRRCRSSGRKGEEMSYNVELSSIEGMTPTHDYNFSVHQTRKKRRWVTFKGEERKKESV